MNEGMLMGGVMAVFGAMLLGGVIFRWEWLVQGRKYRRLAESMGEKAPAILYGLIGLALIVLGVLNALGIRPGAGLVGSP